jgi:hypothetical protein
MRIATCVISCVLLVAAGVAAAQDSPTENPVVGLPLTGQEAVEFLRAAEVVGKPEDFDPVAITGPQRVAMTNGTDTLRAVFKDEDTQYRGTFRFGDGREVTRVKDSYKHEIAAYELDTMLGLGIVPPCVERRLFSRKGSLCLWVEDSVTEAERRECALNPPDSRQWVERKLVVRLFQQLIADLDFSNIRNLVVDGDFRIYKVDSSMAFHPDSRLMKELDETRYSRRFLAALESLDRNEMDERLAPWLTKAERKNLWTRRDRILELARARIAEHGEAAVLY